MATQLKGCKRGVFGLASWEPVKIPESLLQKIKGRYYLFVINFVVMIYVIPV